MLPRIEAEVTLGDIQAMGAAFGGMKRSDRERYLGRLQRIAQGEGRPAKASPQALAAMGVAVVIVPPADAGGDNG